jgi:hypothetical protein
MLWRWNLFGRGRKQHTGRTLKTIILTHLHLGGILMDRLKDLYCIVLIAIDLICCNHQIEIQVD